MRKVEAKLIRDFSDIAYFKIYERHDKVRGKLNTLLKKYYSKKISKKEKERIKNKIEVYETGLGCYEYCMDVIEKTKKRFLKKR
ncbi:hypothetical protein KKB44_03595 [Candidatus Micrarchaeota archaeon]|nr:hypothetical protein [Candidatus Micrarchaeota archaeon]MBU1934553.1 hypothetical protein [Patescibacteria group bacterium]